MKIISHNTEETIRAGLSLSGKLKKGDIIAFSGDLGAGKTHLIKGIVEGLGSNELVTSPTFNIVQEYRGGRIPVFHFDFYRLEDPRELVALGFEEYIFGGGICLMEWAEKVEAFLPGDVIYVRMKIISENEREIDIEGLK
jgi:tRNA threonylcarbamoyladenosine biosynthesis protein TsaE